ncbi:MAG TPA: ATP-binding protein, partial [Polyangiaceae bacterium]|nr:ATP-binding protein [Polyangiaceae bacterium]
MHKSLALQIRQHLGSEPPPPALAGLLGAIDEAYRRADDERERLERSLDRMGHELLERDQRLERDLEERGRLEIALRQAEKLKAVGQLAAGIAHEINTPMQFAGDSVCFLREAFADVIRLLDERRGARAALAGGAFSTAPAVGRAERGEADADLDFLLQEIPKALERTSEGITRVGDIVRAMRAFARPDRREKAPADLNAAIANTLVVARVELAYVADVETDFGELPAVVCHVGDLNQVFLSLLLNAAHAVADAVGESGGRGTIRVRTYAEGGDAVVAISDTGCGVPEAARGRVFEPFFTTRGAGRGAG